jgi:hypothetical protein
VQRHRRSVRATLVYCEAAPGSTVCRDTVALRPLNGIHDVNRQQVSGTSVPCFLQLELSLSQSLAKFARQSSMQVSTRQALDNV